MATHFLNSDVIWLNSVDSTNEEAKRRIKDFSKPTWIISKKQSKGKGRNGKSWFSSEGNFSGSLVFFPNVERSQLHLYGFFSGVALYNTLKKILKDGTDIVLKWPNDLLIENGKVAGILLESVYTNKNSSIGLIIGVGVNLNTAPSLAINSDVKHNAECVANFTNEKIDFVSFFRTFNKELIKLEAYIEEKKIHTVLKLWQTRSYEKGSIIKFSGKKGELNSGIFLGLDEIGGLIVGKGSGVKKIYSGDVYFGS